MNELVEHYVVVIIDGIVTEIIPCDNTVLAYDTLLAIAEDRSMNFDEYTKDDIDEILDDGYYEFGKGNVQIFTP